MNGINEIEANVKKVLGKVTRLTNSQRDRLLSPSQLQKYAEQKTVLAETLTKLLEKWVKKTGQRILVSMVLVHSTEDFGSCAEIVTHATRERMPETQLKTLTQAIHAFWHDLTLTVLAIKPCKVFQDGLPVCDERPEILTKILDETQGANYQLLRALNAKGTKIMGTESLSLLLQERKRIQEGIFDSGYDALLQKRDAFVAARIDQTLLPGEIGLALMGALHRISFSQDADIWKIDFPSLLTIERRQR